MRRTFAILWLCGAALGCSPAPPAGPSPEEVRAAIEERNAKFGEAVRAGDGAIGAFYTADGAALPPGAPAVTGTEALSAFWSGVIASGIADVKLTTEDVAWSSGEFATEVGSASLFAKDGTQVDDGKYLVLWRKTEAGWRMHRDIWNSNLAPAPPAGSTPEAPAPAL